MKKNASLFVGFFAILVVGASPSFAASISLNLSNGGLGQSASNPRQFGVAVCNKSGTAITSSVPVSISVGGKSATISSAASIASGQCQYSYVDYAQFDMQPGQTYSVDVAINSQSGAISGASNEAVYSVTVPAQTTAVVNNNNLTANASAQLSNPFSVVWNWITGLFKR
jgi:hypothetical protein